MEASSRPTLNLVWLIPPPIISVLLVRLKADPHEEQKTTSSLAVKNIGK